MDRLAICLFAACFCCVVADRRVMSRVRVKSEGRLSDGNESDDTNAEVQRHQEDERMKDAGRVRVKWEGRMSDGNESDDTNAEVQHHQEDERMKDAGVSGEKSASERHAGSESSTVQAVPESYAIVDVFKTGEVMNNAVKDNMIAFTGTFNSPSSYPKGRREQVLSYHRSPLDVGKERNGYDQRSGIQAYFAKDGNERLPNDSNLPGYLTNEKLTSVGKEGKKEKENCFPGPCEFTIDALKGVEFETVPKPLKPPPPGEQVGQPYVKMRAEFIKKYGGDELDDAEDCFLVFVHHHEVEYNWFTLARKYLSVPTKIQVVGVTDIDEVKLAWAPESLKAEARYKKLLQSPNLCGVCISVPVKWAWSGLPTVETPEMSPCE